MMRTARRELKAIGRRAQIAAVRYCGHLQCRLRTVEERVEHLGVQGIASYLLLAEAIVTPHRVRCRLVVSWKMLGSFARADDIAAKLISNSVDTGDETTRNIRTILKSEPNQPTPL